MSKKPIPLLAGHLSRGDIQGPLGDTIILEAKNEDHLRDLAKQVAERLDIECQPEFNDAVDKFAKYAKSLPPVNFMAPEQLILRSDMLAPKHRLSWTDIYQDCRSRLLIWGWSCENTISNYNRDAFRGLIENRVSVDFLILDSDAVEKAQSLNLGPVCSKTNSIVIRDIRKGAERLLDYRAELAEPERSRLHLKKTDVVMTWSGVAIDPEDDTGRLQVEFYQYFINRAEHLRMRPILLLTRRSPFYAGFWNSINSIWEDASEL